MILGSTIADISDIHNTESQKQEENYLRASTDHWITNLVVEKEHIKTYRNYYRGKRDASAFAHITENYGLGTPTNLGFTPLIKPRIDSLLSQLEVEAFNYSVSCVDAPSIDAIKDDKEQKRFTDISSAVDRYAGAASDIADRMRKANQALGKEIKNINSKYGKSYVDDFVSAAIDVLRYFEQDSHADVRQKLKQMLQDLLVTGECYYRISVPRIGADPKFVVVKPENMFYNKNTNSQYIDTADAIVHREFLTHKQILALYGKYMSADQKSYVFGSAEQAMVSSRRIPAGEFVDSRHYADEMSNQMSLSSMGLVEVFHVEWIALNEVSLSDDERTVNLEQETDGFQAKVGNKLYRQDRYESTRIGGSVYVNAGKSRNVTRTASSPYECGFSYDGVVYNDRDGKPYSMTGALKDLQDAYDLTIFHRANLVANSGVSGSRVNLAAIPKVLGKTYMERILKFVAMKKNGVELIDPTQAGAQLFQQYGDYDNTISGNSITAINAILQAMEYQADVVSGTNPQMLGQIAERDAVSNVKMGIQRSLMRNQDLFELFRNTHNRLLNSFVKAAQIAYKDGMKGGYVMGAKSYTFSIKPEYFSYSDFAITINYSSKDEVKVQKLQAIAEEFAKNGALDPETLTNAVMSESASEVQEIISIGYASMKKERDEQQQLQQQLEEAQQQLKQLQQQLEGAAKELEKSKNDDGQIKQREITLKEKIAQDTREVKDKINEIASKHNDEQDRLKQETVQLERDQLHMTDGPAKEVRNL